VVGRSLRLPVASKTPAEANEHFSWFAMFAGDAPASSQRTRELPGWEPKQLSLIADIDRPPISKAENAAGDTFDVIAPAVGACATRAPTVPPMT
jgi:hypothetical protein